MLIQEKLSLEEKLKILSDAAKYDVACTSSGVGRRGKEGSLGSSRTDGICHSFSADGRCISLLKILYTNQCIYDCKYCINRRSNDILRTAFTPEEVCQLTMEFYRRNYIEGLFLSSGILDTPDRTMEEICRTLYLLRKVHRFNGYIHVKAIPGADPYLIEQAGYLADRMSVNLELATADSLHRLAPGKTRDKILRPMRQIQQGIYRQLEERGMLERKGIARTAFSGEEGAWKLPRNSGERPASGEAGKTSALSGESSILSRQSSVLLEQSSVLPGKPSVLPGKSVYGNYGLGNISNRRQYFVPAGQSTQLIVGCSPETDYQMLSVSEALYRNYGLKRVFYSAYVQVNEDSELPVLPGGPPLLREHRLYQADWLLRYYGFQASELLTEERPNFNIFLDPKCDWALRHLELFPVEINKAPYAELLRVPGIGTKSAMRIAAARKHTVLRFEDLRKLGVVLKRAVYFITCSGSMMYRGKMNEDSLAICLSGEEKRRNYGLGEQNLFRQMSLFDDFHLEEIPAGDEKGSVLHGQM